MYFMAGQMQNTRSYILTMAAFITRAQNGHKLADIYHVGSSSNYSTNDKIGLTTHHTNAMVQSHATRYILATDVNYLYYDR